MIEETLITKLSPLKVYPDKRPINQTLPVVLYKRVSTNYIGRSYDGCNLVRARFQLTIWADTLSEANSIANEVIEKLDSVNGIVINRLQNIDSESDKNSIILEFFLLGEM
jgi:hypothetical protein